MSHLFEFIIVIVMLFAGVFTLRIYEQAEAREHHQHPDNRGRYLIYGLFALTMALIPFTLYKVGQRWKRANANVEIVDMI